MDLRDLFRATLTPDEIRRLIEDRDTPPDLASELIALVLDDFARADAKRWTELLPTPWLEAAIARRLTRHDACAAELATGMLGLQGVISRELRAKVVAALAAVPLTDALIERLVSQAAKLPESEADPLAVMFARRARSNPPHRAAVGAAVVRMLSGNRPGLAAVPTAVLSDCIDALRPFIPLELVRVALERPWMSDVWRWMAGADAVIEPDVFDALARARTREVDDALAMNPWLQEEDGWRLYARSVLSPYPDGHPPCPAHEDLVRFLVHTGQADRVLGSPGVWRFLDEPAREEVAPALARAAHSIEHVEFCEQLFRWSGAEIVPLLLDSADPFLAREMRRLVGERVWGTALGVPAGQVARTPISELGGPTRRHAVRWDAESAPRLAPTRSSRWGATRRRANDRVSTGNRGAP